MPFGFHLFMVTPGSNYLGMPWNANDPFLADHPRSPTSQVIADTELNLEKLDVMNSFLAANMELFHCTECTYLPPCDARESHGKHNN